eukprot:jgi/Mesvir1/25486/Mv01745-RA.1
MPYSDDDDYYDSDGGDSGSQGSVYGEQSKRITEDQWFIHIDECSPPGMPGVWICPLCPNKKQSKWGSRADLFKHACFFTKKHGSKHRRLAVRWEDEVDDEERNLAGPRRPGRREPGTQATLGDAFANAKRR